MRPASLDPVYSHLDDVALKRLNVLAVSADPSCKHALSTEILQLIREQVRKKVSRVREALVVTERRLCDAPLDEVEAALGFGNVVERAGALVRLLGADVAPDSRWAAERPCWQRELSRLLVRYPVLMDHRLAFAGYCSLPGKPPQFELAPLGHLLAYSAHASLPAPSHGLPDPDLRRFAACGSVASGLTRRAFDSKLPDSRLASRTVFDLVFPSENAPSSTPLRGRFIGSLMHLSELRRQETGRSILAPGGLGLDERNRVGARLATIFWDVAAAGGARSGVSRRDFVQALTQADCASFAQALPYFIGTSLDGGLDVPGAVSRAAMEGKVQGVRNAIGMLVEINAMPDTGAAAKWIAGQLVGSERLAAGAGSSPLWNATEILAVLDELEHHGARIEITAADAPAVGLWKTSFDTWLHAAELYARKADMQAVISARVPQQPEPKSAALSAPDAARRRARNL